jgi:hypothetical protein
VELRSKEFSDDPRQAFLGQGQMKAVVTFPFVIWMAGFRIEAGSRMIDNPMRAERMWRVT